MGGVEHPDHGGFEYCRVFVEDFFDFAWVDVVAAADGNYVLFAVDDEVEAVVVASGHVAGVEPAVDDRGLGGLGPLPVALHHVVPADDDFAGLAWRGFGAVRVDNSFRRRQAAVRWNLLWFARDGCTWRSVRSRTVRILRGSVRRRCPGSRSALRPERGTARNTHPEAGYLHPVGVGVQQRDVHRGHAFEDGHPVTFDQLQTAAGSNRGTSDTLAPTASDAFSALLCPNA